METAIPYSSIRIVHRSSGDRYFAADTIPCRPDPNLSAVRADAESLAKKLRHTSPSVFGLLSCHGIIKCRDPVTDRLASINLVFRFPSPGSATPTSLREQLSQPRSVSLTQVLDIACQLARAGSFIHTCEFVHKNLRPEMILMFGNDAYILGFDAFGSINLQTLRRRYRLAPRLVPAPRAAGLAGTQPLCDATRRLQFRCVSARAGSVGVICGLRR